MPDLYMDVDVALAEVPVNIYPLTDDTDFKSRETAVAYNATGMDLVWNFVTTAGAMSQTAVTPTTGGDYDWAHQGDGMYSIEIPASGGASINNDTEGFGWFTGYATGVLPWRGPVIGFRAAALNNALIDGGDELDVNAIQISGDATAADNLELMFDGTGYAGGTTKLAVDAVAISGDSTAADNLEAACDGTGYNVGAGQVVAASVTGSVGGNVTGSVGSVSDASSIATAVWSAATRTLTSFGTLASDTAAAVWAASARTLTSFGSLVSDTAAAVWAASTRTLTSFGTLVSDIWAGLTAAVLAKFVTVNTGQSEAADGSVAKLAQGAAGMTAQDIWEYSPRTLTQSAAEVAAVVAGTTLTIQRGDSLSAALTGLGSITGRLKLWWTVKGDTASADSAALIMIEETAGLVYLNGAAGTAIQGDITVDDESAGDITITLAAASTAALPPGSYSYDVQWATATGAIHTLTSGTARIVADVTRATA